MIKQQNIHYSLLLILLVSACDKVGDCQSAGGRWVEEIGECECTYQERENYDIHITQEELEACMKPRPQEDEDQQESDEEENNKEESNNAD